MLVNIFSMIGGFPPSFFHEQKTAGYRCFEFSPALGIVRERIRLHFKGICDYTTTIPMVATKIPAMMAEVMTPEMLAPMAMGRIIAKGFSS